MRPRIWVIIAAVVVALGFGFAGRAADASWMDRIAGVAWLAAIILGISLLPFWARIIPRVEPMPGLFRRPGDDERWCSHCGTPTPKLTPCTVCGAEPKLPKEKAPKPPKEAKKAPKKAAKGDS